MNTKQLIYALFFIGMASFFAASCGNKTAEKPPTETMDNAKRASGFSADMQYITKSNKNHKDALDTADFNKADFELVKERLKILSTCVGPYCSDTNVYCYDTACLNKIKTCHTVDSITFEKLTGFGENGYAVFRYNVNGGIISLMRANCKKYIRLTSSALSVNIDTVAVVVDTLPYTAHYSVALWQQIAKNPIDSVKIFKAISDPSTKKYLIPFKVYLPGNKQERYDVSNDYP